jgi:predicted AlkP superfamily phosphohydrolase/phosphomutase
MSGRRKILSLAGLAFLFAALCSCGRTTPGKVFFLGVDALDWERVNALRSEGLLPNIDRLIRRGYAATINTEEWGSGSAVYWTDIATGQTSAKHGITGFVYKDPETQALNPVTSNQRRTKAFWNILTERNIPVGVVGWYVTWPAEKVKGFMVSSYFTWRDVQPTVRGMYYPQASDMIHPPSLAKETESVVKEGEAEYRRNIRGIIPLSSPHLRGEKVVKAEWSIMSDYIYARVGNYLSRKMKPRVFAIYLAGIDTVGHMFTSAKQRHMARKILPRYGDVQKNMYLATDAMLAPFLSSLDDQTTVFLVSDHGLMRGVHTHNGVFVVAGPNVRPGYHPDRKVNLTDVCPTLLYLLNLPVAEDMDGRVVVDAFSPDFLAAQRVQTVSSYGAREDSSVKPIQTSIDDKIIERLKALGYLD